MSKRIYDIKPPKNATEMKKIQENFSRLMKASKHRSHKKREDILFGGRFQSVILVIVIMVGVYLFFKLPKADIIIWPKVDTLSFKQTITADKSVDSVDIANSCYSCSIF